MTTLISMYHRPYTLVAYAQTMDGKIAHQDKSPLNISNPEALEFTHILRGICDGILVGIGTVLQDDPLLTCRLSQFSSNIPAHGLPGELPIQGRNQNPTRFVLDPDLTIPMDSQLVTSLSQAKLSILHGPEAVETHETKIQTLKNLGVTLIPTPERITHMSVILQIIAQQGIRRLFIEGGQRVLTSCLTSDIWDELIVTIAPSIQSKGLSLITPDNISNIPLHGTMETALLGGNILWGIQKELAGFNDSLFHLASHEHALRHGSRPSPSGKHSQLQNTTLPQYQKQNTDNTTKHGPTTAQRAVILGPGKAGLQTIQLPEMKPGLVEVESRAMALSAGSEMLFFRGDCNVVSDDTLDHLSVSGYPLSFGYINCGVTQTGQRVFAFYHHQDRFRIAEQELIPLGDLDWDNAIFFAHMETALSICHDLHPHFADVVCLAGLGTVGILTAQILKETGARVIALEPQDHRRRAAEARGITCLNPKESEWQEQLTRLTEGRGWDLGVNVSGSAEALQSLIDSAPLEGRIVEASWYGDVSSQLRLGGNFHRKRLSIHSSQVSRIGRSMGNHWDKNRRYKQVLSLLNSLQPKGLISHRYNLGEIHQAFCALDHSAENKVLQIAVYPEIQPKTN